MRFSTELQLRHRPTDRHASPAPSLGILRLRVGEGVSLQGARLGEALATHGAGVGLGAHVGQAVAQQVGRRGKRLVAHLHNKNPEEEKINCRGARQQHDKTAVEC